MEDKYFYALCTALMCDDHIDAPTMGITPRAALTEYANAQAKERGYDNWISAYNQMVMPWTAEDLRRWTP